MSSMGRKFIRSPRIDVTALFLDFAVARPFSNYQIAGVALVLKALAGGKLSSTWP